MRLFQEIRPKNRNIRRLPYPFIGALAISNDIEFFSFKEFDTFMKFFNTTQLTRLGKGLGLEITSSMFFYSVYPNTFAYFRDTQPTTLPGPEANRINEYLRSGWIDTNHSYGDFDEKNRFRREHALCSYEALSKLGVELCVYTDHGGYYNLQNVGPGSCEYHHGDIIGSSYYHADLMKKHGVRYVWSDSGMLIEKEYHKVSGTHYLIDPIKQWLGRDNQSDRFKGGVTRYKLQDGSIFYGFIRFRCTGVNAPNLSSLGYQLRQIDWAALYKNNGIVILYQHLGVMHRSQEQCVPTQTDYIRLRPEVFLSPFYFLERENKEGRLWVCGVKRLLNYVEYIEKVECSYDKHLASYILSCDEQIDDPELFFQGLTIYTDPSKPVRVCYLDRELPLVFNGPDETHQYSVSVPLKKLAEIW